MLKVQGGEVFGLVRNKVVQVTVVGQIELVRFRGYVRGVDFGCKDGQGRVLNMVSQVMWIRRLCFYVYGLVLGQLRVRFGGSGFDFIWGGQGVVIF